jgi:DNA-binding SARP family transcriptional activator
MKSLSKPMLANIELLLERKPSSEALWDQWLTWKNIEGEGRSMEAVVERIKISPLAHEWTVPPLATIDAYYKECRESDNWPKVIGLLKTAWDREFSRIETGSYYTNKKNLGDWLGIDLIEAYLHDNRFREAEEIFNALLEAGGKFTDISKIVKLAKEKGQERLAREWERKVR